MVERNMETKPDMVVIDKYHDRIEIGDYIHIAVFNKGRGINELRTCEVLEFGEDKHGLAHIKLHDLMDGRQDSWFQAYNLRWSAALWKKAKE